MTTRSRCRHILLATGVALLLGACSGASAPGASAPGATPAPHGVATAGSQPTSTPAAAGPTGQAAAGSDGCRLITRAEAATAFGESMLEPAASTDHGDQSCAYTHEAGGLDLNVSISSHPSSAGVIRSLEKTYSAADIPGIGDAAFEVAGILEFVKGETLVTMGTGDGPAIISVDAFNALAATAAGRI